MIKNKEKINLTTATSHSPEQSTSEFQPSYKDLSIIIPVYNEEDTIVDIVKNLKKHYYDATIIAVDDGSSDNSLNKLQTFDDISILKHYKNRGYGAALKYGMKSVKTPYLIWFDADNEHITTYIHDFYSTAVKNGYDAVLGNRIKESKDHYKNRIFGKWVLKTIGQIALREKIPDLNCGLKLIKTNVISSYFHLLPMGFPASDVVTLILIKRGYKIKFLDIKTNKRTSESKINLLKDGLKTLFSILNIIILFDSFLFFGSLGFGFILVGSTYSIFRLLTVANGFPILGNLIIICGFIIIILGVLSSQISQLRLERLE